ncbi:hypothetical protein CR513_29249, partial [Mucuna pruriens]
MKIKRESERKTKRKMKKKESKSETKRRKEKGKETIGEKSKSVKRKEQKKREKKRALLECSKQKERGKKKGIHVSKNIMLEEFPNVFPKDVSHGLPPLRGIEHHMDLTLGATLPNGAAHRKNPREAKEIQKQVGKLIGTGMKQVMEGFELGIHGKQTFGLHTPRPIMSPKNACALVPRNPLACPLLPWWMSPHLPAAKTARLRAKNCRSRIVVVEEVEGVDGRTSNELRIVIFFIFAHVLGKKVLLLVQNLLHQSSRHRFCCSTFTAMKRN